jgi:hypothetical protein
VKLLHSLPGIHPTANHIRDTDPENEKKQFGQTMAADAD